MLSIAQLLHSRLGLSGTDKGACPGDRCHLGLGIPTGGKWADIHTLGDLKRCAPCSCIKPPRLTSLECPQTQHARFALLASAALKAVQPPMPHHMRAARMAEWTETNPLRVVTGYHNIARKFFAGQGFEHVVLLSADGALEAAPLMGTADIILDLVGKPDLILGYNYIMLCQHKFIHKSQMYKINTIMFKTVQAAIRHILVSPVNLQMTHQGGFCLRASAILQVYRGHVQPLSNWGSAGHHHPGVN